jgi:DNA-directed RNA polymerase I, II, and III subunit RPABC1
MNNREYISMSIKTIFEMLTDRKIDITNVNNDDISEWINCNFNKSTFSIVFNKIKVLYYLPSKFKWPELKKIFEDDDDEYTLILLIVREKVSQNNLKFIHSLKLPVQIFDIKELQFNITNHILVPKHDLINDENEVKSIIDKYNLKTKFQLPHILKNDPMSKYLGLKSGDVIKVSRTSPTAGEYVVYRCCL